MITLVFEPVETILLRPTNQLDIPISTTIYNIMAEARYDVAGVSVTPANPTRESMPCRAAGEVHLEGQC